MHARGMHKKRKTVLARVQGTVGLTNRFPKYLQTPTHPTTLALRQNRTGCPCLKIYLQKIPIPM